MKSIEESLRWKQVFVYVVCAKAERDGHFNDCSGFSPEVRQLYRMMLEDGFYPTDDEIFKATNFIESLNDIPDAVFDSMSVELH